MEELTKIENLDDYIKYILFKEIKESKIDL